MKYEVHRISEPSQVKNLPKAEINVPHARGYRTESVEPYINPDVKAWAQVGWDEEAFFVCLTAREKEILAKGKEPLEAPCEDSCLEFFISPVDGDLRYFNIEFNPNGLMYLGFGENVETLMRLIPEETDPFSARPAYTEDGWQITYRIPFTFIRRFFPDFDPKPGYRCRGNFYKCGDNTVIPHFYSWSPITAERLTFHTPKCFGELELV